VRLLLSRGARVDIAVAHGTPLHIAASYGKTSVLKTLLDHHADVMCNLHTSSIYNFDTWLL
jgi:ankyrin repeat protein